MSIEQSEMSIESLAARLAELEQANTQLCEEVTTLRTVRPVPIVPIPTRPQVVSSSRPKSTPSKAVSSTRKSRRGLLRQGLGVAAAAIGAGTLLEASSITALASGPHRHGVGPNDNYGNFASSYYGTPAVTASGYNGANGVYATCDTGIGVEVFSNSNIGVYGYNTDASSDGVFGSGRNGVHGQSSSANDSGVWGENQGGGYGVSGSTNSGSAAGVWGENAGNGSGVLGSSSSGNGVSGTSGSGWGVTGSSTNGYGVVGQSATSAGVIGSSSGNVGVYGFSSGEGVFGTGPANGVHGLCASNNKSGVLGENTGGGFGVSGSSSSGTGVYASTTSGTALVVQGTMQLKGNPVGQATLLSGKKSVTVTTGAATTSSNIVLTPLNLYKGTVWVTRASGSFTINSSVAQSSNVVFTYLIIN